MARTILIWAAWVACLILSLRLSEGTGGARKVTPLREIGNFCEGMHVFSGRLRIIALFLIDAQNLQHVLFGVQVIGIAFDILANDGDRV